MERRTDEIRVAVVAGEGSDGGGGEQVVVVVVVVSKEPFTRLDQ